MSKLEIKIAAGSGITEVRLPPILEAGATLTIKNNSDQPVCVIATYVDIAKLRDIFAEELEREGEKGLAAMVRSGADNSRGGIAAMRALTRIAGPL